MGTFFLNEKINITSRILEKRETDCTFDFILECFVQSAFNCYITKLQMAELISDLWIARGQQREYRFNLYSDLLFKKTRTFIDSSADYLNYVDWVFANASNLHNVKCSHQETKIQ